MGILAGDIKLVASQVMTDISEGGGGPTSTVIVDGTSNSIFTDISELDRAGGRVNLRKVFANAQTANADTYLGANVVVADGPDDPNVSVTIFKANNTFDVRTDAQNRIESYLNKGPLWGGFLFENHISGQRSIQIFQREGTDLPIVGKTMYLAGNEGLPSEYSQYVRITKVETETRTFSYSTGNGYVDYTALIVTCSLSDALRYDFTGSPPNRLFTAESTKAKLRETVVADAAKYYGVSNTTAPVAIGDMQASINSVFSKLVPSAQTESALVDRYLNGVMQPMVASAPSTVTATRTASFTHGGKYVTPTGIYPGTLNLAIGGTVITDDSVGNAICAGSTVGTVNYQTGETTFDDTVPTASGSCVETYRPAAGISMQAYTLNRPVSEASRAYNWIFPLQPIPAPNSLIISYMSQGNWYELRDKGDGTLAGSDPAYGVGTVSYVTGTVAVTLGALPDIGSEIVSAWGTPQEFMFATDSVFAIAAPRINIDMGQAISPSTLTLTWTSGGVTKTATDNGSGAIVGDATGEINYGDGTGWMQANPLPDAVGISANFSTGGTELYGVANIEGVSWSGTLPNAPIKPESVVINILTQYFNDTGVGAVTKVVSPATIRDDGSGGLIWPGFGTLPGSSVNYTTGAVVIAMNSARSIPVPQYVKVPRRFGLDI